jgi:hypothetical protein
MPPVLPPATPKSWYKLPVRLLIDRLLILLAWLNLLLVGFNLMYVPLRSSYLRVALFLRDRGAEMERDRNETWLKDWIGPAGDTTLFYDPFKGISPEPDTTAYLDIVDDLIEVLKKGGVESPQVPPLLAELRERSEEMINQNPFQLADKTAILEQIKYRMRDKVGADSAIDAFDVFWSVPYLREQGWTEAIGFFDREIRFGMQSNYFRTTGSDGDAADYFGVIDAPFMLIFAIDFVIRTLWIHRRYPTLTIRAAALSHWQDVFLFLPFGRWLRIIPVISRSNQANFPNLEPLRALVSRGFLAGIAGELTEVVVLQVVNQLQYVVRSSQLSRQLLADSTGYVEINDVNEVQAIANRLTQIVVYQVLPDAQDELRALLQHQITLSLSQLPAYQNFKTVPGISVLPAQIAERMATNLSSLTTRASQGAYKTISTPLDPETARLLDAFIDRLGQRFNQALRDKETLEELQSLAWDLLEEVKLSYISRSNEVEDSLQLLEETERLRQKAGKSKL